MVYGRQSQSIVPGHSAPGPQSRWRCLAPTTAYANYAKLKGLQLVKLSAGDSPRAADTPARVADESGTRFVLAQRDVAVDDPAAVPQTPFVRRLVLRQLVAAARRLDELHIMLAGFLDGANTTLVISRSTSRFGLQALTTDVERLCVVAVVIAARLTELAKRTELCLHSTDGSCPFLFAQLQTQCQAAARQVVAIMIQEERHLAAGHMAELRPFLDGVARRTALLRVGTDTTPIHATWALPQVEGVGVPRMCTQRHAHAPRFGCQKCYRLIAEITGRGCRPDAGRRAARAHTRVAPGGRRRRQGRLGAAPAVRAAR